MQLPASLHPLPGERGEFGEARRRVAHLEGAVQAVRSLRERLLDLAVGAHAHLLGHTARQFARAIVMPNLRPPVVNVQQAREYRARILAALPQDARFQPLMTLYLTDRTSPDEIAQGVAVVRAMATGEEVRVPLDRLTE